MPYNDKYIMEWTGNAQVGTSFSYKLIIAELEDIPIVHDLIELKPAGSKGPSPFTLNYRAEEEFAFSPLRTSDATINFLLTEEDEGDGVSPEAFYDLSANKFLVKFYQHDSDGPSDTLKWSGFLITDLLTYEWQERYYLQLRAIDNLGSLKYIKYSRTDMFEMFNDQELFTTGTTIIKLLSFILSRTGLSLNINVGCNWKYDDLVDGGTFVPVAVPLYFDTICYHQYAGIDFEKYEPLYLHQILTGLIRSLGCILYQSNDSGTWNIINMNEIGNGSGSVDVRRYDPAGDFLVDTAIDFEASINTGSDELVWALRDQLISINQGIGSIEFKNKTQHLNLLNNYGFFKDEVAGVIPDWNDNPLMLLSTASDTGRPFGNRTMRIDRNETHGTLPITEFTNNFTEFTDTCLSMDRFGKKVIMKARWFYQFSLDGIPISNQVGSNGRVSLQLDGSNSYFLEPTGDWHLNNNIYLLPFFVGELGPRTPRRTYFSQWTNYITTSKSITLSGAQLVNLEIGAVRYPDGGSDENSLFLDDVYLVAIPVELNVKEFGYKVTRSENDFWLTKKVDVPLFHGGTDDFVSSFLYSDVFYIERDVQSGEDFVNCLAPHANWLRSWESASADDESSLIGEDLSFKVARNYISFYRTNGKRFEGTIHGLNIGFLRWFNINLSAGHHTMITASFDYGTSFTKVVLHEDFSEEEEDYYDDLTVKYTHDFNETLDSPGTQNDNDGRDQSGGEVIGKPAIIKTEVYVSTETSIQDDQLINKEIQAIIFNNVLTQQDFTEAPYNYDPETGTIDLAVDSGDRVTFIFSNA
jgi:hypothetical protein